jgi:hypothetical protein
MIIKQCTHLFHIQPRHNMTLVRTKMPSDTFGLSSSTLAAIQQTLANFPDIEQVTIDASRAMERERPALISM